MKHCPKCRHEYADTVERCVDCGGPLRQGRPPVRYPLDLDDYLLPAGELICGLGALLLLLLRVGAQLGWITGPFARFLVLAQPPWLTIFYAIAVIVSVVALAYWTVTVFIQRR
jgi:hypothetical protein